MKNLVLPLILLLSVLVTPQKAISQCSFSCDYTINMFDSYGDGWNGASVEVLINAVSQGTFSVTGGCCSSYSEVQTFSCSNGDAIRIRYTAGSYEGEVTYNIVDPFGTTIFSDGTNPATGIVHNNTASCGAPDSPCSAQSINFTCYTEVSACNSGATNSGIANPGCGNYVGGDIWYETTIPASGEIRIQASAGTMIDAAMALYTGTCGSLSLVTCDDNSGVGNMPLIYQTGLTGGASAWIRVWEEGNDIVGDFGLYLDDPTQSYCLINDAIEMAGAGNCVQLTSATNDQLGCAWEKSKTDFSSDFDYSLDIFFGASAGGADGMTMTFQNSPDGTDACGTAGGQLGAGGIANAVVVEFDTYDNDNPAHNYDMSADHIAITTDGDLKNTSGPAYGPVQASASSSIIDDGVTHTVRLVWTAATTTFQVYFDGSLRLTAVEDFVNTVFGSNPEVHWGFTGATGGLNNQQYFCPVNLPLAVELLSYDVLCTGGAAELSWTVSNATNLDVMVIERSANGSEFIDVATIQALGFMGGIEKYIWEAEEASQDYYYRLRFEYIDEAPTRSTLIASHCAADEFKVSYALTDQDITLNILTNFSEDLKIEVLSLQGQVLASRWLIIRNGYNEARVDLPPMASGVYILRVVGATHHYTSKMLKTVN